MHARPVGGIDLNAFFFGRAVIKKHVGECALKNLSSTDVYFQYCCPLTRVWLLDSKCISMCKKTTKSAETSLFPRRPVLLGQMAMLELCVQKISLQKLVYKACCIFTAPKCLVQGVEGLFEHHAVTWYREKARSFRLKANKNKKARKICSYKKKINK